MNCNHVLLVVRKDLRAHKFEFVLYTILLILYVVVLGWAGPAEPGGNPVLMIVAALLPGVLAVFALVLIAVLVQDDQVAGTSAFWLTRPVRGASLLVAKGAEIAAIVGLGFVAELLALAGNGAGHGLGYLAFDFAVAVIPLVLVAVTIAALSPSLPRFFLTIFLGLAAFAVGSLILGMVTSWFVAPESLAAQGRTDGEKLSAQVVAAALVALGAVGVIGWQFTTRRCAVSIAAALGLAGIAIVVGRGWSHDFIAIGSQDLGDSGGFADVRVEIDPSDFRNGTSTTTGRTGLTSVSHTVSGLTSIHGLPAGTAVEVEVASTRITAADGRVFLRESASPRERLMGDDGIAAALGGAKLAGERSNPWWREIVRAGVEDFEQFGHQPCTLETVQRLHLYRYELLGELPLEVAAQGSFGDLHVRITAVDPHGEVQTIPNDSGSKSLSGCEVFFNVKFPNWKLRDVRESGRFNAYRADIQYVLINRDKNEAVRSRGGGGSFSGGMRPIFVIGDQNRDFEPAFAGMGAEKFPQIDAEWLAGASFAILKRRYLGVIERSSTLRDVVFERRSGGRSAPAGAPASE